MNQDNNNQQSKLTIILAESELERIPQSILHHPQIKSYAKKRKDAASHLLLDATYHHAAMRSLTEWSRRGRPDIIHRCILFVLDSWANTQGLIELFVHTRNDEVIWINQKTRLPRQYNRFVGLFEQLFKEKEISTSEDTLLTCSKKTLKDLVNEQNGEIILFWEKGQKSNIFDMITSKNNLSFTIILGGFPHGDFHHAPSIIDQKISIEDSSLTASYIIAKTIINYEQICHHHY
jgi:rRNA small subunit pseudouridine methyltransferase Nep1